MNHSYRIMAMLSISLLTLPLLNAAQTSGANPSRSGPIISFSDDPSPAPPPETKPETETETGITQTENTPAGHVPSSPEQTPAEIPEIEEMPTVIESDHLKMITLDAETKFVFSENVSITTTDMMVYCDRLEVFAGRSDAETEKTGEEPAKSSEIKPEPKQGSKKEEELGRIQRIYAIGNVRVVQGDREATSGRAEVFPREGKVVLTENPVLRSEDGKVSGGRITFIQGEGKAIVESDPAHRPRVELRPLPAVGSGDPF